MVNSSTGPVLSQLEAAILQSQARRKGSMPPLPNERTAEPAPKNRSSSVIETTTTTVAVAALPSLTSTSTPPPLLSQHSLTHSSKTNPDEDLKTNTTTTSQASKKTIIEDNFKEIDNILDSLEQTPSILLINVSLHRFKRFLKVKAEVELITGAYKEFLGDIEKMKSQTKDPKISGYMIVIESYTKEIYSNHQNNIK